MILYYNTSTGDGEIFQNRRIASKVLGISYDTLNYHFIRQKKSKLVIGDIVLFDKKPIKEIPEDKLLLNILCPEK